MSAFNRSEWRRGKSLEFKTRDRGFASPQQRRRRVQFIILQMNSFQFINHIMAERRRNTTGRSGVVVGRWCSQP